MIESSTTQLTCQNWAFSTNKRGIGRLKIMMIIKEKWKIGKEIFKKSE